MKIRRDVILVIMIPLLFVASIQFIMALSFTGGTLEEKLTIYDIDYNPSDFEIIDIDVDYISDHEMVVDFEITGGDGVKDMYFEVFCRDMSKVKLVSMFTSPGSLTLQGIGSQTTKSYTINYGDFIGGDFTWENVPSGNQLVRLSVQLENIYLDTWTFQVEVRND